MKRYLLVAFTMLASLSIYAQSGDISGKIKDEKGEGIPFATISILQNGVATGKGTQTDFDGNYSLKPLTPGKYDVKFSYVGYTAQIRTGVLVSAEKSTFIDVQLKPSESVLNEVQIIAYKVPLIDAGQTTSGGTVTQEEIAALPTRDIQTIAASTSGAYMADEGSSISIKGGRSDATAYYVDGVRVRGAVNVPASAIGSLTVITGGVPAKYGDATGGAISISTRGPSNKFTGGLEMASSEYMDAFGYNLVSANLTGPIFTNKKSKKTILGFFISGEFERERDPDPNPYGAWAVKKDALDKIKANQLINNPAGEGFILASESLTRKDLELKTFRPNVANDQYRAVAKLSFKPSEAIDFTAGFTYNYEKDRFYVDRYSLMNAENNPKFLNETYRGFLRMTHNIGQGKIEEGDKSEKKSSAVQNAYYTIQADYEKYKQSYGDDSHGDRLFNYGYIGKFDLFKVPIYLYTNSREVIDSGGNVRNLSGWQLTSARDDSVYYTPSDINDLGAALTSSYFDLVQDFTKTGFYENLNQIQSNKGLINGERSALTHDIWFNPGRQYNGYGYLDNDQYTIKLDGAFDILKPGSDTKNKHSIEFGFSFEQRIERNYNVNPLGLWTLMRTLANSHITEFDTKASNPTLLIDGQRYQYNDPNRPDFGYNDTILADRIYNESEQKFFDKNLRAKLNKSINGTEFINIDALDPSFFSLDMFSADELLNSGAAYENYQGYDYLGNKLKGRTSFNEFFTKKDANGNMKRDIPSFQPIYIAGYIQDKFQYKDLYFNVGVRVDRYDANQKIMSDPYSLYEIYTASEYATKFNSYSKPSNIGDDFAVYVDDNTAATPNVVGYRNGDIWYDALGNQLASGTLVAKGGASGKITPYFTDPNVVSKLLPGGALIRDPEKFNPDGSFSDFKPQINIMPRLQFSFSLTDKASFFAHYDILTQRPQANISGNGVANNFAFSDPFQYLWFDILSNGGLINNPNLKPEKTIDFELGFQQKVSNTSAIKISAFYREFKDQVQIIKRNFTYPGTSQAYRTLGNVDFGTTKGFTFDYDLRRTGNLQMKINYTLQFAEGTGSSNQSQNSIVSNDQPNFRTISSLDYDARHTFNVTLDWRYKSGSDYNGPYAGKQQLFSNAGINFTFVARSGTPYTKQSFATPNGLNSSPSRPVTEGSLNGARLPWTFRLNAKVNKDFTVKVGKKKEGKEQGTMDFSIYLQVQNLLNTKNVTGLYRYTGNASDDGYLGSASGKLDISGKPYADSYVDLYRAFINNPGNYSRPRSIRLGLIIGF